MKYKIQKGLIIQKIGGKITIFDSEKSKLYSFNQTASYIFSKIKTGISKERIIANLRKKYNISEKKAILDVEEYMKELKNKKIIS